MKTTRRNFLKGIAAAGVATVAAPNVISQRRQHSAVVIGAGLAGLAAAYRLKNAGWNVTVLEAHATRTNLPERCCEVLVLRRVYHHFSDPEPMNASMWESLKPGGLLAVLDFAPDGAESPDPADRDTGDRHGVTSATVVRELREAGFEVVVVDEGTGRGRYMVVVRRPPDPRTGP